MIRISYLKIKEEDYEKIFSIFYQVLGKTADKNEFNKILFDLLTPAERIMLIKRIAIIYLLMKEIHYKTVCEVLKVSNTTLVNYCSGKASPRRLRKKLKELSIFAKSC